MLSKTLFLYLHKTILIIQIVLHERGEFELIAVYVCTLYIRGT